MRAAGRWQGLAALLVCAGIGVTSPGAAAAAQAPLASASYGKAEIVLQRTAGAKHRLELLFKGSPHATLRVLAVTVPPGARAGARDLTLGLDAHGVLTAVIDGRSGLEWTHVRGTPRLHRVPGTSRDSSDVSLRRGQLAYCDTRIVGDSLPSAVHLGSLAHGHAPVLWTNHTNEQWEPEGTVIGAGHSVAFVAGRDGAGNGADELVLVRPGHKAKRLLGLGLGDSHTGGLAIVAVTHHATRLVVEREFDDARLTITYALPSGHRLSTTSGGA